jgi:hypothetical protein
MARLIPFLLLYLLLLASACTKEDVKPSLEGRWNYQSTTAYVIDRDGKLFDESTPVWPPHYLVITGTVVQYFSSPEDQLLSTSEINGQSEIVTRGSERHTVTKLTAKTLTWLETAPGAFFGRDVELTIRYVR